MVGERLGSGRGKTARRKSKCSAQCLWRGWGLDTKLPETVGFPIPDSDLVAVAVAVAVVAAVVVVVVPEAGSRLVRP